MLHPLEFAALLAAARTSGPNDHALVCLLGMLGLRVSEACATDITDIRYEAGYPSARACRGAVYQGCSSSPEPSSVVVPGEGGSRAKRY